MIAVLMMAKLSRIRNRNYFMYKLKKGLFDLYVSKRKRRHLPNQRSSKIRFSLLPEDSLPMGLPDLEKPLR